ncbi:hypothetical protein RRF57_013179 [Xylaria bambusicola]|uniref:N-acetyltransferase domain-containing protein n=1 Tax=Xylaria bambusicola TaxID=326684 RepID=A0AAN7UZ12_9PEZI
MPSDIPQIAQIGAKAFETEPIYERFYPLRQIYRDDYLRGFVDEAHKFLITPGYRMIVAEIEGNEDAGSSEATSTVTQSPKIVGYATFISYGPSAKFKSWNPDSFKNRLKRLLFSIRSTWTSFWYPNRAIWWPAIREYYRQAAEVKKSHLADPKGSSIDFKTLAVDPAYQRQKIGEKLIEWCGMTAWRAGVPVFGDATTNGLPLYLKSGCKDIGRIHLPKQVVDTGSQGDLVELDALEIVVLKWETKTNPLEGRTR